MESVVLPEETKTLISKTVQSLSLFKKLGTSAWEFSAQLTTAVIQTCMAHPEPTAPRKSKHQFKLDETISSSGLVMLFYGDSGVVCQLGDQGESGDSNRIWPACRNLKERIKRGLRRFLSYHSTVLECVREIVKVNHSN